VSTPHRGSRVADAILGALDHLPGSEVEELANAFLHFLQKTVHDIETDPNVRSQLTLLSEKYMTETFNPTYEDDPRVAYTSYAGRSNGRTGLFACGDSTYANAPLRLAPTHPVLFVTGQYLEQGRLVVNDGLVTVDSARWGRFEQCIPADHLGEIGWNDFDQLAFYRTLVQRIRREER